MRILRAAICVFVLGFFLAVEGVSQTPTPAPNTGPPPLVPTIGCDAEGRVNGIYYTGCFPWLLDNDPTVSGNQPDGYVSVGGVTKYNDQPRLQRAINAAFGKLVFNENDYYINDALKISPYRTLVGTGRDDTVIPGSPGVYKASKIVQTASNKAVFTISGGVQSVSIRDLAFVSGPNTIGNIGILAQNGSTAVDSTLSVDFEFSNLKFSNFAIGISANGIAFTPSTIPDPNNPPNGTITLPGGPEGQWRFDNVKLDMTKFQNCKIGVHVNTKNSGWSMKNLNFTMPPGIALPAISYPRPPDPPSVPPLNQADLSNYSFGVYLQRIGYATLDLLIGDGPLPSTGQRATALVYVGDHANLNIQSSIDEGFLNSVFIYGGDTNSPVTLINNTFQSQLTVRQSTVVSTGNQFTPLAGTSPFPNFAKAFTYSKIYSVGDRFCFEYNGGICNESTNFEGYLLDNTSQLGIASNRYRTAIDKLRVGPTDYHYDITRRDTGTLNDVGILEFNGVQGTGYNGGDTTPGYAGYRFKTNGGVVQVNYDGSVTFGSKNYYDLTHNTNLRSYLDPPNGTAVYCSDCQKTTPCNSGGSGALAKRINGAWDCN